jgi:hypothetical protein
MNLATGDIDSGNHAHVQYVKMYIMNQPAYNRDLRKIHNIGRRGMFLYNMLNI